MILHAERVGRAAQLGDVVSGYGRPGLQSHPPASEKECVSEVKLISSFSEPWNITGLHPLGRSTPAKVHGLHGDCRVGQTGEDLESILVGCPNIVVYRPKERPLSMT